MCTIALTRPSALRRTATIALAGDLDDHDRRAIADVIVAALTAGCDGIEIDLSGLTFFGAAGANALVESRNACHGAATALTLARPPACVRRTLQLTGLAHHLGVEAGAA